MRHSIKYAIAVTAILAIASCGGKESMASKSAEAYRQAIAQGKPVGAAVHGGHAANTSGQAATTDAMAGMDHGSMAGMQPGTASAPMAGMDHSQADHGAMPGMKTMPGMQHGSPAMASMPRMQGMPGMSHGAMGGMDHAQMQPGSHAMANMPAMQHSDDMKSMPGMQHGGMIPAGGLWGAEPGSLPASPTAGSPTTSSPLHADALDAAAPASVAEARKSASDDMSGMSEHDSAGGQQGLTTPSVTPPEPHAGHAMRQQPATDKQPVTYTCPMHPEVVSSQPGTCPKCGMLLVRRATR